MYKNIDNTKFNEVYNDPKGLVLDVRTEEEFKSGYLPNAIHIDILKPNFESEVAKLDKSKNYYVYCRSGGRSESACSFMASIGFTNLYNLQNGILGWNGEIINK